MEVIGQWRQDVPYYFRPILKSPLEPEIRSASFERLLLNERLKIESIVDGVTADYIRFENNYEKSHVLLLSFFLK